MGCGLVTVWVKGTLASKNQICCNRRASGYGQTQSVSFGIVVDVMKERIFEEQMMGTVIPVKMRIGFLMQVR